MLRELISISDSVGDEEGSSTIWSIFWTVIFMIIGGFVIDASNGFRYKAILQATADSGSISALMGYQELSKYGAYMQGDDSYYTVQGNAPPIATIRAEDVGHDLGLQMMKSATNGTVVPRSNVVMGTWDDATRTFTAGATPYNAARVTSVRTEANGNRLDTLLFGAFTSFDSFDVGTTSVAHTRPLSDCPSGEGIMAGGTLDFSSNNSFQGKLCLHGEVEIDFNNNNDFLANTLGEYPGATFGPDGKGACQGNVCDTQAPYSVIAGNTGLTNDMINADAIQPDIQRAVDGIVAAIANPQAMAAAGGAENQYIPSQLVTNPNRDFDTPPVLQPIPAYLATDLPKNYTSVGVVNGVLQITLNESQFTTYLDDIDIALNGGNGNGKGNGKGGDGGAGTGPSLIEHAIYNVSSQSCNKTLTLDQSIEIRNIVINTACAVSFSGSIEFNDSTLVTSDPSNKAVRGSAGVRIGNASCSPNSPGGSLIVSTEPGADIDFAAKLALNGSQIISNGDIHVSAQAGGSEGTSLMAANDIKITSNTTWTACDPPVNFGQKVNPYVYRLVE